MVAWPVDWIEARIHSLSILSILTSDFVEVFSALMIFLILAAPKIKNSMKSTQAYENPFN